MIDYNPPLKVSPAPTQSYDRGLSDHTGESDNSYSFWQYSDITNGRNIDLLGGNADSESQWQGGDSDQQTFSPSETLGQPEAPRIHFDKCITLTFHP